MLSRVGVGISLTIALLAAPARAEEPAACGGERNIKNDCDFLAHKLANALFGSMAFTAEANVTNGVFDASSIGQRTVPELNESEFVHSVGIGWSDRPVLRDIYLLSGGLDRLATYRQAKQDPWRWAFMDALTVSAGVGWGTTISPDGNKEHFDTQSDLQFNVGIKYSVPLESIGAPYADQ